VFNWHRLQEKFEKKFARSAACVSKKLSCSTCAHCASSKVILSIFSACSPQRKVHRGAGQSDGQLAIVIRGPWLHTILFEIPVLAIINEVYFRNTNRAPDLVKARLPWLQKCRSCKRPV
jgi:hypothetical protein